MRLVIVGAAIAGVAEIARAQPIDDPLVSDAVAVVHTSLYNGNAAALKPLKPWSLSVRNLRWISAVDMPADLRTSTFRTHSFMAVDVDTEGRVVACRVIKPSTDERLDRIACDRALGGKLEQRWGSPGRRAGYTSAIFVSWTTMHRSERPPEEKMGMMMRSVPGQKRSDYVNWPRLRWSGGAKIDHFPDLQTRYPTAAKGATGRVSLELVVTADTATPRCTVGVSSGLAVLDAAACREAQQLAISFTYPCLDCYSTLPLQFVWKTEGSFIRVPLAAPTDPFSSAMIPRDPADTEMVGYRAKHLVRFDKLSEDFLDVADLLMPNWRPEVEIVVDREGAITECKVARTTGSPSIDERLCLSLRKRAIITPQTDIFGDTPAKSTLRLPMTLDHNKLIKKQREQTTTIRDGV